MSNDEFYDGKLVLPPSPLQLDDAYGLKFTRVDGAYVTKKSLRDAEGGADDGADEGAGKSRSGGKFGRPGTNRIEADEICTAVAEHARARPDLSLGIVAFSKSQAEMITEVLEHNRRNDEVLDGFLGAGKNEDVFVKNIETVQGDERDVILVSVGYGPASPGARLTSMRFGP